MHVNGYILYNNMHLAYSYVCMFKRYEMSRYWILFACYRVDTDGVKSDGHEYLFRDHILLLALK